MSVLTWKCPTCGANNPNSQATCACRKGISSRKPVAGAVAVNSMLANYEVVITEYPGAYCAASLSYEPRFLIIVPARNADEAVTGSGILAIAATQPDAWARAVARINEPKL